MFSFLKNIMLVFDLGWYKIYIQNSKIYLPFLVCYLECAILCPDFVLQSVSNFLCIINNESVHNVNNLYICFLDTMIGMLLRQHIFLNLDCADANSSALTCSKTPKKIKLIFTLYYMYGEYSPICIKPPCSQIKLALKCFRNKILDKQ